ncbi:MAG: hypothetical protein NTU94_11930 [Planctomycetota bacterium]|nr:hypothetical protein [Planctomycetota bacterium]
MSYLKITAVQTFLTQPCGQRLIIVKVLTGCEQPVAREKRRTTRTWGKSR